MRLLPAPDTTRFCPECMTKLTFKRILWQGIHVCAVEHCAACGVDFASDFPMGQAAFTPFQVNLSTGKLYGPADSTAWFGQPLADGLNNPSPEKLELHREGDTKGKPHARLLVCLDYVYGHALLKLLNAAAELDTLAEDEAFIVVVQPALRWLVPKEAHAVWRVSLPFGEPAQRYYPALDQAMEAALSGFEEVRISPAWSHPYPVNITRFSGVDPHDFEGTDYRVTYVWRGQRGWAERGVTQWAGRKLGFHGLAPKAERARILELFENLRGQHPQVRYTVAGLGAEIAFPEWIEDERMEVSTPEAEKRACQIYAESRLVIGPHGSNMLLPTAHAGMAIILMPPERWANLAQDTLMHGSNLQDPRIVAWRYRYLTDDARPGMLAQIASLMLSHYRVAWLQFRAAEINAAGSPVTTDCLTARK